ncbi:signal recognition particleSRP14 subunit [Penicillium diatomitis]|uniref:Signal recognition particle subunit SRP14 n=1 Tax=Penicillium diatomitis TaxID=2819901 RepID=A0A9W9WM04_9EURO|nr:signal recognition particleSRP14 subunit [Penicillium diatomitis]KAJ5469652.1 signal recognition particleSRP14 subunit [Penicillium diatomitis]
MAPHLDNEARVSFQFFSSLAELLAKTSQQAHGSVFLSQKPLIDGVSNSSPSILIRATDGNTNAPNPKSAGEGSGVAKTTSSKNKNKVKLSTIVESQNLDGFYTRYADICKAGMTGLKKRDRSKRKAKGKSGAAKTPKA